MVPVQKEGIRFRYPSSKTLLIVLLPLGIFACAQTKQATPAQEQPVDDFDRYFSAILGDYLSYPTHKALAVGRGHDGRFVFAYRINQRQKDRAISAALEECQKRASWFGRDVECELYAEDNEVLVEMEEKAGS